MVRNSLGDDIFSNVSLLEHDWKVDQLEVGVIFLHSVFQKSPVFSTNVLNVVGTAASFKGGWHVMN